MDWKDGLTAAVVVGLGYLGFRNVTKGAESFSCNCSSDKICEKCGACEVCDDMVLLYCDNWDDCGFEGCTKCLGEGAEHCDKLMQSEYDAESFSADEEEIFRHKKQIIAKMMRDAPACESCGNLKTYTPTEYNRYTCWSCKDDPSWGAESFSAEKGYRNYGGERWDFITRILVRDEVDEVQNGMNRTQSLKRYPSNSGGPKWLRVKRTKEWPGNGRNEYYYYWGLINPEWLKARKKAESFSADSQTRFYRNLGVGAALVAGLAYWIKR